MFKQITTYVSNLLSSYLCGFRKGDNHKHVLLRLKNKTNKCLGKKECAGLFMMVFDCTPHKHMITKLHAYGFEKTCLKLVYSYLKGINQRVKINKTINNLNPNFMDEIFCVEQHNYPTRNQNLIYPNPRTVSYGLETLGYKACQIWKSIPQEIKIAKDIATFKSSVSEHNEHICKCNLCKLYITNLGYINT